MSKQIKIGKEYPIEFVYFIENKFAEQILLINPSTLNIANPKGFLSFIANNLEYIENPYGYFVRISPQKMYNNRIAVDICNEIDDGNLSRKGLNVFSKAADIITQNLKSYYNEFIIRSYL